MPNPKARPVRAPNWRTQERLAQLLTGNVNILQVPSALRFVVPQVGIRGENSPTTLAWPSANDALFTPFVISEDQVTVMNIFNYFGAGAGNYDVGIYDANAKAVVTKGAGAINPSNLNAFTRTFILPQGRYYLGMSCDSATPTTILSTAGAFGSTTGTLDAIGCKKMASAYPLPATAVFAAVSIARILYGVLDIS